MLHVLSNLFGNKTEDQQVRNLFQSAVMCAGLVVLAQNNSGNTTATSAPQKQKLFKRFVQKNKKAPKSKPAVNTSTEELLDVSDVRSVQTRHVSRFGPTFTLGLM